MKPLFVTACLVAAYWATALYPSTAMAGNHKTSATDIGAAAIDGQVSMAFIGDVMLADGPGKTVARGQDPLRYFEPLLGQSEIRVANLECVVATIGEAQPAKPWTFRAHPRTLDMLRRHVDVVDLANNHSGDFGPDAFAQMLGLLKTQNIAYFGGGYDLAEAHRPLVLVRNGLRIAMLGYNEFFPRSFEANVHKPGVAWSEDEQVAFDIQMARQAYQADIVIAMMHWGWEYEPTANARQRQLAHHLIDAGADVVIGSHPHVVQDVEVYRDKPVIYSLGNFVFDGFNTLPTTTGWLLQLDLDSHGARAWRVYAAHIDQHGTPKPISAKPVQCWRRDDADAGC